MPYNPAYVPRRGHSASNGGITPEFAFGIVPGVSLLGVSPPEFYAFDPQISFNDGQDGSFHSFKVEELLPMRNPTVRRVGVIFRDMGVATFFLQLSAVDDNFQVNWNSDNRQANGNFPSFTVGTAGASQRLCQKFLDTSITGALPQLTIIRNANSGALSISKIWMEFEQEETGY